MESSSNTPSPEGVQQVSRRIKAHRKSRSGCLVCKTRKVKCCETRPQCSNCARIGEECVWPEPRRTVLPVARLDTAQPKAHGFSMKDLQLFHTFLTASYPTVPIETDDVWVREVPVIAQEHDFLMHAILALGAAHLNATTNLDMEDTAQRYRMLAIKGLNSEDHLAVGDSGVVDDSANARATAALAACYALAFASTYMGDPLGNFLVLVRGCASMTIRMVDSGFESNFIKVGGDHRSVEPFMSVMRKKLQGVQPLDPVLVADAQESFELVAKSCTFRHFEWEFFQSMKSTLDLAHDPIAAYAHYIHIWQLFARLSSEDFTAFVDVSNFTSMVLHAHFLALEVLVRPWTTANSHVTRKDDRMLSAAITAFPDVARALNKAGDIELVRWPRSILASQSRNGRRLVEG